MACPSSYLVVPAQKMACLVDGTVQPVSHSWYDDYRLVLLPETYCLFIVPSIIFLLVALGRVWYLRTKPKLIGGKWLLLTKLVSAIS